jgi:hypothetical protein
VFPSAISLASVRHALAVSPLLRRHFYGRSRIPPLSALLQRQFRPLQPSPVRPDALLIRPPDWFEARVALLEQYQQLQRRIDALRRDALEARIALIAADD